jgi:hypothetical protein
MRCLFNAGSRFFAVLFAFLFWFKEYIMISVSCYAGMIGLWPILAAGELLWSMM